MNKKIFFNMKMFTLFIVALFVANFVFMSFSFSKETKLVSVGVVEQFFSGRNFSGDIIANMLLQKTQNKTDKKTDKKNDTKIFEYILPNVYLITSTNLSKLSVVNTVVPISSYLSFEFEIEYPLKIPFREFIFLLLILKLLFSVLPRSISINYNKKNIEAACIV